MNLSPDNPFRTTASFWRCSERAKTDPEAAELLARSYREAWNRRGYIRRSDILVYLTMTTPPEGVDLVFEALRSRSEPVLGSAAIAAHEYMLRGRNFDSDQNQLLSRTIWKSARPSTIHFALWAIEPSMTGDEYEALLESMRLKHPLPDSRFDAAYELLCRGRVDVTADLIREMLLCDYPHYAAERLLWERVRGILTPGQLESVRVIARQEMDKLRSYASRTEKEPWTHAPVFMIEKWVQGCGMPFEPGDIDLVGEAAIDDADEPNGRLDAIKALGWFANDAADAWLRRLSAEGVAQPVRKAARSQLRKRRAALRGV